MIIAIAYWLGVALFAAASARGLGRAYSEWDAEVIAPLVARRARSSLDWPGTASSATEARFYWIFPRATGALVASFLWPIATIAYLLFRSGAKKGATLREARLRAAALEKENEELIAQIKKQEGWA